jgi:hypothetical protein
MKAPAASSMRALSQFPSHLSPASGLSRPRRVTLRNSLAGSPIVRVAESCERSPCRIVSLSVMLGVRPRPSGSYSDACASFKSAALVHRSRAPGPGGRLLPLDRRLGCRLEFCWPCVAVSARCSVLSTTPSDRCDQAEEEVAQRAARVVRGEDPRAPPVTVRALMDGSSRSETAASLSFPDRRSRSTRPGRQRGPQVSH